MIYKDKYNLTHEQSMFLKKRNGMKMFTAV